MTRPPGDRPALAWLTAALLASGCVAWGTWAFRYACGGGEGPQDESWLQESHAELAEQPPAPARDPAPRAQGQMPNFTLWDLEKQDVPLYQDGVAPAVVTDFLLGCGDCRASFQQFPTLAEKIRAAEEVSVNVAYMGDRHVRRLERYFQEHDFAGPVRIDKGSQLQRRYRIGTFTVWLLDRDGTVRFQGTPAAALPLLDAHLARRQAAR